MDVRTILAFRGRAVHTITPDSRVEDALGLRAGGKPLPFMVVQGAMPIGIVEESHLLDHCLQREEKARAEILVKEVMSNRLIIAGPGDEFAGHAAAMLRRDIEVLAVVEGEQIIGMMLLRDLMRHQIELLTAEIENLREYLSSLQDAMMD